MEGGEKAMQTRRAAPAKPAGRNARKPEPNKGNTRKVTDAEHERKVSDLRRKLKESNRTHQAGRLPDGV